MASITIPEVKPIYPNRKTNLFYLEGNSSNFLTFSNYGEYLTGVCLSTNYKIYPSSFMCLNLPFDNDTHSVENFKKFLMCYYENKLAYMRDFYEQKINTNSIFIHQEQVMSLSYLFESIYLFFGQKPEITYFGDIVEHDYNGTYSDSICIVDFKRCLCAELLELYNSNNNSELLELPGSNVSLSYVPSDMKLYGWQDDNLGITAIVNNDEENTYTYNTYNEQSIFESLYIHEANKTKIEFNCVIPLFDVNNLNINQNDKKIIDNNDFEICLNNKKSNNAINENYDVYKYIPYGIWFSSDIDNPELNKIQLYRTDDNISQTWSLVIASKFSPYPYGLKMTENSSNNVSDIYTYAELLKQQAELMKSYNEMVIKVGNLSNDIQNMKTTIKSINALDIDDIRRDTQDMISNLKIYINNALTKIDERFAQFAWENIDKHTTNN